MNNLKCEKIVKSLENTGTDKITSSVRILKTYADIFSIIMAIKKSRKPKDRMKKTSIKERKP